MGKQKEGSLQERIQKLIERKGGKCYKNWGNMTSEPGRPDIVAGYHGYYLAIEAKVDNNVPSAQQGIECRNIWRAGNIAIVAWCTHTVEIILNHLDYCIEQHYSMEDSIKEIKAIIKKYNIDDGTRW